jgi:deoxyribodipyrimidine photo-lyase
LHSGQISAQKIIFTAKETCKKDPTNLDNFISEVFVWREVAEHFVYHEKDYDNLEGALLWARETLINHSKDKRTHIYSLEELENSKTGDVVWNAANN